MSLPAPTKELNRHFQWVRHKYDGRYELAKCADMGWYFIVGNKPVNPAIWDYCSPCLPPNVPATLPMQYTFWLGKEGEVKNDVVIV